MHRIAATCLTAACAASASAFALSPSDQFGSAASATPTQRVIQIDSNTRYINVRRGETVILRQDGKSVSWNFDGIAAVFKLSQILPRAPDKEGREVQVYVDAEALN